MLRTLPVGRAQRAGLGFHQKLLDGDWIVNRLIALVMLVALSGCVSIARVDSGTRTLGTRLEVSIEGPWNHVSAPNSGPAETWTMDGLPIDQLLFYAGHKEGVSVHAPGPDAAVKRLEFRAAMQPDLGRGLGEERSEGGIVIRRHTALRAARAQVRREADVGDAL